jgi:hypothetical protein
MMLNFRIAKSFFLSAKSLIFFYSFPSIHFLFSWFLPTTYQTLASYFHSTATVCEFSPALLHLLHNHTPALPSFMTIPYLRVLRRPRLAICFLCCLTQRAKSCHRPPPSLSPDALPYPEALLHEESRQAAAVGPEILCFPASLREICCSRSIHGSS